MSLHMCNITLMTIIIHVHLLFLITILDIYDIASMLHYFDKCCRCLLNYACVFFALTVVLRSSIKLGWVIYLIVHPSEVMEGRLVNMWSVGYNNCK